MTHENKIVMLVTTASTAEAAEIAKHLVEKRLAACCSIIQNVQSIYWWEGKITEDAEVMLIIKTIKSAESNVIESIKVLHSYQVPEIISLQMVGGFDKYFQWIDDNVSISDGE